jgi:hypothetical protein
MERMCDPEREGTTQEPGDRGKHAEGNVRREAFAVASGTEKRA